ncbi:MAG: hypothetical protein H7195_03330 [Chryseobacterium sp.]|nr:hypothetical protein [Chryseobacterium sp.]
MNKRLLDIVQNPDLLVLNDIEILENEISKYPFVQSYRAVQLLATHRFKENDYAAKLSETAAFTTDKKILYHLIHQKEIQENREKFVENNVSTKDQSLDQYQPNTKLEKLIATPETKFQEVEIKQIDLPKKVYTDGELNRILFEGEEDFLNEENENIDIEATQEAGAIVMLPKEGNLGEFAEGTRKFTRETIIKKEEIKSEEHIIEGTSHLSFHEIDASLTQEKLVTENQNLHLNINISQDFTETTRAFTTETIIDEDKIKSEENIIESTSQLSFHGSEEFLPTVKIEIRNEVSRHFVAENKVSKHEAEMQKLIAEVEAKMKKSSVKNTEKDEGFAENSSLDFMGISHEEPSVNILETQTIENNSEIEVVKEEPNSTWKPINFSAKKSAFRNNEIVEKKESNVDTEEKVEVKNEEFKENISDLLIVDEVIKNEPKITEIIEGKPLDSDESNVPVFINTWQSWLKLKPETTVLKENSKQKAIESFIEKEPKISKLKVESNFTFKDRGDNISHLMTETLANLYLDQKLYLKAQKAFELLIEKEPTKAERFKEKLLKIKELRNQK